VEEILIVILQFILELGFDILSNIVSWPSRDRPTPEPETLFGPCFLWLCVGCLLGSVSLLAFHYTLIHSSILRTVNLFLAPLISAYLSKAVAARRAEANANILPRNHFWYSLWFTLGLVAVRFAYASR
jgi:hypothetical protein